MEFIGKRHYNILTGKRHYNILTWFPWSEGFVPEWFQLLEKKYSVTIKDRTDFRDQIYNSQADFDRVCAAFQPDIVVTWQVSANGLYVHVPENIWVITWLDMFLDQFVFLGERFFNTLPDNNYIFIPVMDIERYDFHHVLDIPRIRDRIISFPFVAPYPLDVCEEPGDVKKYETDIVITTGKKRKPEYYKYPFGIDECTMQGKAFMQLLGYLGPAVHREILDRGAAFYDKPWATRLLIHYFDKLNIWQYTDNKELLLEAWNKFVHFDIVYVEMKEIVVQWIMESKSRIKLWGLNWDEDPRFQSMAGGYLPDCGKELYWATHYGKISIDLNPYLGLHRKTFQAITSGCLNMTHSFSDDLLVSDYRRYFKDGESIVIYKNKKDLLSKIDYYLSHEQERQRVIRNGKKAICDNKLYPQDVIEQAFGEFLRRIGD